MTKLLLALGGAAALIVLAELVFPGIKPKLRFARTATRMSLLPKNEYITISKVPLGTYGNSRLTADYVVVSQYGIFVIQEKPFSGRIFGKQNESRWTRISLGKEHTFKNPLYRSEAQIEALQSLLGLDRSAFIPIIVFSGGASSWVETSVKIVPGYELKKAILSYRQPRLSYDDVQNSSIQIGELQ